MKGLTRMMIIVVLTLLPLAAFAGNPDTPPGPPASGSGMPTLQELYNYLTSGTEPSAPGAFEEPTAGPGDTMETLKEIYEAFKALIVRCSATPADVRSGVTFFSTDSSSWGPQDGTIPTQGDVDGPNGAKTFSIPDGYYNGKTATANDADLVAGNIKQGVSIFGVTGTVVGPTGNASDADVLAGKTYSNASGSSTGTMPNKGAVTITPGRNAKTIAQGYHNGTGTVAGDADLVAGNIKNGVNIFGVTGTVIRATGNASDADVLAGKTYSNASGSSTGTMANRGAVTITPGKNAKTIAEGYHNGTGTVAGDADLVASNIKNGVNIFGVTGTFNGLTCSGTLNGTRWCDNGDGTVTDMTTGLVWLKNASWGGGYPFWASSMHATNAHDRAALLWDGSPWEGSAGLSDGSVDGDWRLPTKSELSGLANGSEAVRSGIMRAFTGVQSDYYWSSTTNATTPYAWLVYLLNGYVNCDRKTGTHYVWPVRGGL